jgi:hypothetical protein
VNAINLKSLFDATKNEILYPTILKVTAKGCETAVVINVLIVSHNCYKL